MSDVLITQRRWYEKQPELAKLVHQLEQLPVELSEILAKSIIVLAEKKYHVLELMEARKSLGQEKILALFKAKYRRRALDQNLEVFRALNHLMTLPAYSCQRIAEDVLKIFNHLYDYMTVCKFYHFCPYPLAVSAIASIYVQEGEDTSKIFIELLEEELTFTVSPDFGLVDRPLPEIPRLKGLTQLVRRLTPFHEEDASVRKSDRVVDNKAPEDALVAKALLDAGMLR